MGMVVCVFFSLRKERFSNVKSQVNVRVHGIKRVTTATTPFADIYRLCQKWQHVYLGLVEYDAYSAPCSSTNEEFSR